MKRICIYIIYMCICCIANAQTQQGIVKTRGRMVNGQLVAGQRLSGATITLNFGNALVSGSQGGFSFNVPSGKTYSLVMAKKQGYTLADPEYTQRSFKYSASNPFYVVLEDETQRQADINAATKKVRRTLTVQLQKREDEIEALKEQNKITEAEYQKKLQELYDNQSKSEQLVQEMAERYASTDYDLLDEFNQKVQMYIEEGELQKADSLLKTKDVEQLGEEIDKIDSSIKKDAEELKKRQLAHKQAVEYKAKKIEEFGMLCHSHYEVCLLEHKNDSAAYWLELRASKDTMNVEWQLEVGSFIENYLSDYNHSLYLYEHALSNAINLYGEINDMVANCYNNIGTVYHSLSDYKRALECQQKALEIRLAIHGENHTDVASSYNNIGYAYFTQAEYTHALEYYQKSLDIKVGILGEKNADVALSYNNIGYVYGELGNYSYALELFKKALKIHESVLEENHPNIAASYNSVGYMYATIGDYTRTLECFHKALNIVLLVYGENHPNVATCYNNIGYIYSAQEDYSHALDYYQKALKIDLAIHGEKHPDVASTYNNIGAIYGHQGDYAHAMINFQKALEVKLDIYGNIHPDVAIGYDNIGYIYSAQKKYLQSLEYYQKALSIRHTIYGENHPNVANSYDNVAKTYIANKKHTNAKLDGFDEFFANKICTVTITDGGYTANDQEIDVEYYVLELENCNIDLTEKIFDKIEELQDTENAVLVMKDGVISRCYLNATEKFFSVKHVGKEEKMRIVKAYNNWKKSQ